MASSRRPTHGRRDAVCVPSHTRNTVLRQSRYGRRGGGPTHASRTRGQPRERQTGPAGGGGGGACGVARTPAPAPVRDTQQQHATYPILADPGDAFRQRIEDGHGWWLELPRQPCSMNAPRCAGCCCLPTAACVPSERALSPFPHPGHAHAAWHCAHRQQAVRG